MDSTTWVAIITTVGAVLVALIALIPLLIRPAAPQGQDKGAAGGKEQRPTKPRELPPIKRIEDPEDPDFRDALALHDRATSWGTVPGNAWDAPEDIARWFKEVHLETKDGRSKLADYFLVAKVSGRVGALLYGQYYPDVRLMFISYMVVDRDFRDARQAQFTAALVEYLATDLQGTLATCEGVVFELEYGSETDERQKSLCRARYRRFRGLAEAKNIVVREIVIPYMQPKLSLWEDGREEERLHLMYARIRPSTFSHGTRTIPRSEAEKVLRFVYKEIYGDHFDTIPDWDTEYRAYVNSLYERAVSGLPDEVPVK
jgi:hypothetical protein